MNKKAHDSLVNAQILQLSDAIVELDAADGTITIRGKEGVKSAKYAVDEHEFRID